MADSGDIFVASWNPLDTSGFVPRWDCGLWSDELGWTHILSDLATWGAYTGIPISLVYFIRRRKDIPFPGIFFLFGAFILLCGTTHLLEAVIFWWPVYRLSAVVKFLTAAVSVATLGVVIRMLPTALSVPEIVRRSEENRVAAIIHHQSANRIRSILDSIHSAVAVLTKDGTTLTLNKAWRNRWPETALLSGPDAAAQASTPPQPWSPLLHPDVADAVRSTLDHHTEAQNLKVEAKSGDPHDSYLVGISPLDLGEDGAVVSCTDISTVKRLELELMRARDEADRANKAKTMFLAGMSHELRTPLTAIIGLAEELRGRAHDPDEQLVLDTIRGQGDHLLQLVNDVLDLSRVEVGQLSVERSPTPLLPLLDDVMSVTRPLAEAKELSHGLQVDKDVPERLLTDPLRLKQILINLVSNAIKFTSEGYVSVAVGTSRSDEGDLVSFAIADSGPGILVDDQPKIFEPFEQVHPSHSAHSSGVGLGLALSNHLVQIIGGTIRVDSAPGQGSTFTVTVPMLDLDSVALAEDRSTEGPSLAYGQSVAPKRQKLRGRILVAEDTRAIQILLERMLSGVVDDVTIVGDGADALERLQSEVTAGRPFDLVLLDMHMPKMDGFRFTQVLREKGEKIPIIALTASAMKGDREGCLEAGCDDYIPKPVDRRRLYEVLAHYLKAAE